jgi:hypothetical protein
MIFKLAKTSRDPTEIDWLLFFWLFPAVVALAVVSVKAILIGIPYILWLTVSIIFVLLVPFLVASLIIIGAGFFSILRLWWALIRPAQKQSAYDYICVAGCSLFGLGAVVYLQSLFLNDYWRIDFEGKDFFYVSIALVTCAIYPLLALVISLRVHLRSPQTAQPRRHAPIGNVVFGYVVIGLVVVGLWVISVAGVVQLQGQIVSTVKSMRMASAP